jgi:catechol 2,3-dioxygenase-like lactoylglutathione lyase family enzyme
MCQSLPYAASRTGAGTTARSGTARFGKAGATMIGRLHHLVLDCPDPDVLAQFYSELLGWPVTWQQPDFAVVAVNDRTSGLAFQLATDYQAPDWPDPTRPQQLHLDVMVDDLDEAEPRVLALGARRLAGPDPGPGPGRSEDRGERRRLRAGANADDERSREESGQASRVFADPAGHPFCLIPRPSWAPPVHPAGGAEAGAEPGPEAGPEPESGC